MGSNCTQVCTRKSIQYSNEAANTTEQMRVVPDDGCRPGRSCSPRRTLSHQLREGQGQRDFPWGVWLVAVRVDGAGLAAEQAPRAERVAHRIEPDEEERGCPPFYSRSDEVDCKEEGRERKKIKRRNQFHSGSHAFQPCPAFCPHPFPPTPRARFASLVWFNRARRSADRDYMGTVQQARGLVVRGTGGPRQRPLAHTTDSNKKECVRGWAGVPNSSVPATAQGSASAAAAAAVAFWCAVSSPPL
jgi:hypothetical protein